MPTNGTPINLDSIQTTLLHWGVVAVVVIVAYLVIGHLFHKRVTGVLGAIALGAICLLVFQTPLVANLMATLQATFPGL